jgi:hypothetical protein
MSAAVGGTQKVRAVVLGTLDQVRGSPAAHACWQHCIHLLRRMQDGIVVSARYCSFSAGWQSDHYCTLFGCFRELKLASQYPHADGSTSLKTVIGKSPAPSPPVGEHTENPTFQAVRGIGFRIARASSRKCFGIRCEADLQARFLFSHSRWFHKCYASAEPSKPNIGIVGLHKDQLPSSKKHVVAHGFREDKAQTLVLVGFTLFALWCRLGRLFDGRFLHLKELCHFLLEFLSCCWAFMVFGLHLISQPPE